MVEPAIENDFEAVVDGQETLTLLRRGGGSVGLSGRRVSLSGNTTHRQDAGVDQMDVTWDLPWPEGEREPAPGDKLVSAEGFCGAVLSIEPRGPGRRYRTRARQLEINAAVGAWVEIQEAVWEDLGSGPEITGYRTLRPAVLARVQPTAVDVDHSGAQPSSTSAVRITLAVDIPLNHNHRIIGPLDEVYRVDRFVDAQRDDRLPAVEATLIAPA